MSTYEREWFVYPEDAEVLPPRSRLRHGITTSGGNPIRFLVQLGCWDGFEWQEVARFDHDTDGPSYRDVERSGLHLDVYDPEGTQVEKVVHWPPEEARAAMPRAERYLRRNADYLVTRFEAWR